jgi:hypothetical protein
MHIISFEIFFFLLSCLNTCSANLNCPYNYFIDNNTCNECAIGTYNPISFSTVCTACPINTTSVNYEPKNYSSIPYILTIDLFEPNKIYSENEIVTFVVRVLNIPYGRYLIYLYIRLYFPYIEIFEYIQNSVQSQFTFQIEDNANYAKQIIAKVDISKHPFFSYLYPLVWDNISQWNFSYTDVFTIQYKVTNNTKFTGIIPAICVDQDPNTPTDILTSTYDTNNILQTKGINDVRGYISNPNSSCVYVAVSTTQATTIKTPAFESICFFKGCFCPTGYYMTNSINCSKYIPPTCAPCSICPRGYFKQCDGTSNAICTEEMSCVNTSSNNVLYPWLAENPSIRCKKGFQITNMSGLTPTCSKCPSYLAGLNGIWCEPCVGYSKPTTDSSMCVCILPAYPDQNENCICGPGYRFHPDLQGCVTCAVNTYSTEEYIIPQTSIWTAYKYCTTCPLGTYADTGATACIECPQYTYRSSTSSSQCLNCPTGQYTLNKTSSSYCQNCSTTCSPGYYSTPCPTDPSLFICHECSALPAHAYWIAMTQYTTAFSCVWECSAGYYRGINECVPCSTSITCPPGKMFMACTPIQDYNCDWDCQNDTKPLLYSEWASGCDWKCSTGYHVKKIQYSSWVQYECVLSSSLFS